MSTSDAHRIASNPSSENWPSICNERRQPSTQSSIREARKGQPTTEPTTDDNDDGIIDVGQEEPFITRNAPFASTAGVRKQPLGSPRQDLATINGKPLASHFGVGSEVEQRLSARSMLSRNDAMMNNLGGRPGSASRENEHTSSKGPDEYLSCVSSSLSSQQQWMLHSGSANGDHLCSQDDLGYHSSEVASISSDTRSKCGSCDSINTLGRKSASPAGSVSQLSPMNRHDNGTLAAHGGPRRTGSRVTPYDIPAQSTLERSGKPPPLSLASSSAVAAPSSPVLPSPFYSPLCFPASPFYGMHAVPGPHFSPSLSGKYPVSPFTPVARSGFAITADAFLPPTPTMSLAQTAPYAMFATVPPPGSSPYPGLSPSSVFQMPAHAVGYGMGGQPPFTQYTLLQDAAATCRSHPLYPLLRDMVLVDDTFDRPSSPIHLLYSLPSDLNALIQKYLDKNPPAANKKAVSGKCDQNMERVFMESLRLTHESVMRKIEHRRSLEKEGKLFSRSSNAIDDFFERFDKTLKNNMDVNDVRVEAKHMTLATDLSAARRENGNLPTEAVRTMKQWLLAHLEYPYPNDDEKDALIRQTRLSIQQINYWFTNARRRLVPNMTNGVGPTVAYR
ncbi:PREDICTED: uncharacterized protein LOC106808122 isoform X2 [Priapulus caudatus]|nr:PREDICTED: uncharacterized protein LOC106808122 isoform X2 [Priapulus caudatus]